jgi:hypothetical protein
VQVKEPDTLTISAPDRAASVVNPAREVTVTVAPPAPPVVVPATVAYPSGPDDTADGAAVAAVTAAAGPAAVAGRGAGLVDRAVAAVVVAVKAVPVEAVVDGAVVDAETALGRCAASEACRAVAVAAVPAPTATAAATGRASHRRGRAAGRRSTAPSPGWAGVLVTAVVLSSGWWSRPASRPTAVRGCPPRR